MRVMTLLLASPLLTLAACQGGNDASANVTDDAAAKSDAAAPAAATEAQPAYGMGDAKVAGTDYHATTNVPCTFAGKAVDGGCLAGVKRGWGDDGGALVEVTKPDGRKRAIFFKASGAAFSADSAQADGSAGWDFKASRTEDDTIVDFGPEHYEIPDMLINGG